MVPEHKLLSPEDKQKVLAKYNVSEVHLPRILASDPAIIGLNAELGDVILIHRKFDSVADYDYYRIVVKG